MRIIKKIITRMNITILLIIVQIVVLLFLVNRILYFLPQLIFLAYAISLIVVFILIKKDKAAAYKVTWIIVVMALPILGGLLYLLFGDKRPVKRIAVHMEEHALIAKALDADCNLPDLSKLEDSRRADFFDYIRKMSSYHVYENTETKYYKMGEDMFEDILLELSQAKRFIFIEFFIVKKSEMWDKMYHILVDKANQGVDVRILVDDLGSAKLFSSSYVSKLEKEGIKVIRFNPIIPFLSLFMNNRDHRKVIVIDGNTAFNGGINIGDEYINLISPFGLWKDTGIKLKGDGVWSFTLMFIEMWDTFCKKEDRIDDFELYRHCESVTHDTDGLVLPFGDSPLDHEALGENVYIDILNKAKDYVYIFTPYLIISEKLIYAIQMAAKRGVDVRVVMPGIPDKRIVYRLSRSYYGYLLKAGAKVYEFTPGFIHAKSFVSDDEIAVVGTINLDYRSLYLHFECATILYKASVIKEIKEDALETIGRSHQVVQKKKNAFLNEMIDAVLHLFAPLM
jgi:cardiolipin synthase